MMNRFVLFSLLLLLVLCLIGWRFIPVDSVYEEPNIVQDDWPQWRGPNRDGISQEKGLLKKWPTAGPKIIWKVATGEGYSGISISTGRAFTMFAHNGNEYLICLDASNGKELWRTNVSPRFRNDQGHGPRSTPTVDDGLVYALGAKGFLLATNAKDGKKIWGHDLAEEYGGKIPTWGISTSPVVEGDLLLVDIGGKQGHSLGAFHKKTGELIWNSQTDEPGYSSPIVVTMNGYRQALFFTGTALVSVSPKSGELLWRYPWKTSFHVNAATPLFVPDDKVFISSSYGVGAAVVQINNNGVLNVETLWKSNVMKNHFSSSVLIDRYIYGFDDRILKCIDAYTGEEQWKQRGFQKGSLIYADGHLIILGERGKLALVEATPAEYKEKAKAQVLRGKCWTMPTLANGKLYLRNQKELLCLDVTGKKS